LGTAASSATLDSRTRRAEPKVFKRLVRMVAPTPGMLSSTDEIVRFVRSFLWYVIAKRWASSGSSAACGVPARSVEQQWLQTLAAIDLLALLGQGDDRR